MALITSAFQFMFGWLPYGLYIPVYAVFSCALLIVVIKVLTALVQLLSKAILLFVGG